MAVSKTKPISLLTEAYACGQRDFGENKVQELCEKQALMPEDIRWHLIGHLQSNKAKYIAPFIWLIHSVDSLKLLQEINKQGEKNKRLLQCLLQVYIAREETKFGLEEEELYALLRSEEYKNLAHVKIRGLMGMASNTEAREQVRQEFKKLRNIFEKIKQEFFLDDKNFDTISMGMSGDYELAVAEGSTMIRVGSSIFGGR